MKKQAVIIPAFASLWFLGLACGKDSKKSPAPEADVAPIEDTGVAPVAPIPGPAQPETPVTPASSLKMVGLRFGSEYLTLLNEKIYNVDARGNVQSEVQEVRQSQTDPSDVRETPVAARPRRIDPLNEEFFLLLQPEYNTCSMGPCEWNPTSIRPQSNYLINKKSGEAWEIDSTFVPVPGTVKFVENKNQKTVFFLAHDARDRRFWDYYPYNKHYATSLKEKLFVYGRKTLIAIDISRPDQKILQPISGNLNVVNYEVDRNGNAAVTDMNIENRSSVYLIARNGTQPVISLVKDPKFLLKYSASYVFPDQDRNLYRYYSLDYGASRIAKIEIAMEEGRAVLRTVNELPLGNSHTYGADVAAIREDKDTIYVAIKGEFLTLKKDFSEVKIEEFSSNPYLDDLYLEILPDQKKALVAGRSNQLMVATQIDLVTNEGKAIPVDAIEGKLTNVVSNQETVDLITLDEATDTTLVHEFDAVKGTFFLKEKKPGQVDDRLRILVKVSGDVSI